MVDKQETLEEAMEEKQKEESIEEQEISQICFNYAGTDYIMEFDRESVAQTERMFDFTIGDVRGGKASAFEALFHGSFLKHHPNIKTSTVEMFLRKMPNKQEVFKNLATMYSETISVLFEEPEEGEAISWTTR